MGNISEEMLTEYVLGESSAADALLVEEWINAHADNKQQFEELQLLWQQSKTYVPNRMVNENSAWQNFMLHTQQQAPAIKKTIPLNRNYDLLKVAAVLLVLLGSSWLIYMSTKQQPESFISQVQDTMQGAVSETSIGPADDITAPIAANVTAPNPENTNNIFSTTVTPVEKVKNNKLHEADCQNKSYACNSTPCPLEICIIQKNGCLNGTPVSNCSVIQPDEAGRLCYKASEEKLYNSNCNLTVEEITIKRIETGEMIVLNGYTKVTAQDLFGYITGQKNGDVVAGMFNTDCDEQSITNSLTIGNNYGTLHFR
jgi:virulence-associated protein VapD